MGRGWLTNAEIEELKKNEYVIEADHYRITYSDDFKVLFMKNYNSGQKPKEIFEAAGFDPEVLGSKRIERAAARWKESYKAGSLGRKRRKNKC